MRNWGGPRHRSDKVVVTAADFSKLFCELEGKFSNENSFHVLSQTPSGCRALMGVFFARLVFHHYFFMVRCRVGVSQINVLDDRKRK